MAAKKGDIMGRQLVVVIKPDRLFAYCSYKEAYFVSDYYQIKVL